MTIVFHDKDLYTELKVEAARKHTAASDIVAEAVRESLERREDTELLSIIEAARSEWKEKGGRPWSEVETKLNEAIMIRERDSEDKFGQTSAGTPLITGVMLLRSNVTVTFPGCVSAHVRDRVCLAQSWKLEIRNSKIKSSVCGGPIFQQGTFYLLLASLQDILYSFDFLREYLLIYTDDK